jgi:uncharacterized protein YdaU (DUF1376 family)
LVYFSFFPKQWLGDDKVLLMDWDARGMHLHLMCMAWQQDPPCTIPADEAVLRKWCGNPKRWAKVKNQILAAWKLRDGRYVQEGLLAAYERACNRSESGRKSANARWTKKAGDECGRNANALHRDMPTQCYSDTHTHKEEEETLASSISLLPNGMSAEEVLAAWNAIPGAKPINSERLTPNRGIHKRISVLTTQHKDNARAWWDSLFEAVRAQSGFLFSGNNKKQWVADLPWILGPENLAKVLERRYEAHRSALPTNGHGGNRLESPFEVVL